VPICCLYPKFMSKKEYITLEEVYDQNHVTECKSHTERLMSCALYGVFFIEYVSIISGDALRLASSMVGKLRQEREVQTALQQAKVPIPKARLNDTLQQKAYNKMTSK
jgi:hypothetical protein